MFNEVLKSRKKSERKTRLCMFDDCQREAIKSHVLQKNGILREISEKNHLIQLLPPNPYELNKKGIYDFKKVGINDVYTFKGFCKEHDNDLFEPIESKSILDFTNANQQALLSYRGLCQEIRRKEIAIEGLMDLIKLFPIEKAHLMHQVLKGYEHGIKNLSFFKREFEREIKNNKYSCFEFKTIKIPRIDLCISVPLNITTSENENLNIPFSTSFVNVFPKDNYTYVISGFHKDYKCSWTKKFLLKMKSPRKDKIFKELSDLVTMRLEFWTMSPKLFKKIPPEDIDEYKRFFLENLFNHDSGLRTKLNIFKNN
jgi:hypothetical protein